MGHIAVNTLHDLFVEELKDIYGAEQMIVESMPKMIDAASSNELKHKFENHLNQTKEQVHRLEHVFQMLDMKPEAVECEGMEGILEDGEKMIEAEGDPNVKDAGLVAAAQKVEHYEISSYGTLREFAKVMGHDDVARELSTTLDQESDTDEMLTQFAERSVNVKSPKM